MNLLAAQTDSIETLRERELLTEVENGYLSTYLDASQTGDKATWMNRKRPKRLKQSEK